MYEYMKGSDTKVALQSSKDTVKAINNNTILAPLGGPKKKFGSYDGPWA